MGTYADLLELSQESPVAAPDAAKSVEHAADGTTPAKRFKLATKRIKEPQAVASNPVAAAPSLSRPRRNIARESFDVYQDQHEVLRQVSLTAKLGGEQLSISEMVREALDEYIHRKALRT
jgi:hypothetical protein